MKPATARLGSGRLFLALGLPLAVMGLSTCYAVEKLGMAPYTASVEKASAADRLQITTILTEVANAHGMKKGDPIPRTMAYFTSPPSALGLSMSAGDQQANGTVTISIGAAGLGIKLNARRKAVIAEVDAGLRRAFSDRLKK